MHLLKKMLITILLFITLISPIKISTESLFNENNFSYSGTNLVFNYLNEHALKPLSLNYKLDILSNKLRSNILSICSLLSFVCIFMWFFIFINNRRKRFLKALKQYSSHCISIDKLSLIKAPRDISPAFVNLLYNRDFVTINTIIPCILYLLEKEIYEVVTCNDHDSIHCCCHEKHLFNVNLRRVESPSIPDFQHLKNLIGFISRYEENGMFSIISLKEKFYNNEDSFRFKNFLYLWEKSIKNDAKKLPFNIFFDVNERFNWLQYREYLSKHCHNIYLKSHDISSISSALIYGMALEINKSNIDSFLEKTFSLNLKCNCNTECPNQTLSF